MTKTETTRRSNSTTRVVRALVDFYGSPEAVEDTGLAYRLGDEWIVTDEAVNVAANLRRAAQAETVEVDYATQMDAYASKFSAEDIAGGQSLMDSL